MNFLMAIAIVTMWETTNGHIFKAQNLTSNSVSKESNLQKNFFFFLFHVFWNIFNVEYFFAKFFCKNVAFYLLLLNLMFGLKKEVDK